MERGEAAGEAVGETAHGGTDEACEAKGKTSVLGIQGRRLGGPAGAGCAVALLA